LDKITVDPPNEIDSGVFTSSQIIEEVTEIKMEDIRKMAS